MKSHLLKLALKYLWPMAFIIFACEQPKPWNGSELIDSPFQTVSETLLVSRAQVSAINDSFQWSEADRVYLGNYRGATGAFFIKFSVPDSIRSLAPDSIRLQLRLGVTYYDSSILNADSLKIMVVLLPDFNDLSVSRLIPDSAFTHSTLPLLKQIQVIQFSLDTLSHFTSRDTFAIGLFSPDSGMAQPLFTPAAGSAFRPLIHWYTQVDTDSAAVFSLTIDSTQVVFQAPEGAMDSGFVVDGLVGTGFSIQADMGNDTSLFEHLLEGKLEIQWDSVASYFPAAADSGKVALTIELREPVYNGKMTLQLGAADLDTAVYDITNLIAPVITGGDSLLTVEVRPVSSSIAVPQAVLASTDFPVKIYLSLAQRVKQ